MEKNNSKSTYIFVYNSYFFPKILDRKNRMRSLHTICPTNIRNYTCFHKVAEYSTYCDKILRI